MVKGRRHKQPCKTPQNRDGETVTRQLTLSYVRLATLFSIFMSLICHTIVSRYSPPNDKTLEEEAEIADLSWRTGTMIAPAQRLHTRAPPLFVPASLEYDEFGMPKTAVTQTATTSASTPDVSSWYRKLTSRAREKLPEKAPVYPAPSYRSGSREAQEASPRTIPNAKELAPSKVNWFSSLPLHSDGSNNVALSSSSLSDLLERNPPPLSSEQAFTPPVFLFIGPSNIGFNMLQRKGWQEGEGLGSGRIEPKGRQGIGMSRALRDGFSEEVDIKPTPFLSGSCRQKGTLDIIDLTISDSEDDTKEVVDLTSSTGSSDMDAQQRMDHAAGSITNVIASEHHGTTLLTPIATTLKSDKLGIGLKSRRRKAAKAITHSPTVIAAHIHASKRARQSFKARFGRGSKGFARAKKMEDAGRVNLLAYLNS